MKYLFIDESGDHNLQEKKIDPTFPLFVLTGICIERQEYRKVQRKILKCKQEFLGSDKVVLHSLEMVRPQKSQQIELKKLSTKSVRNYLYNQLNKILLEANFQIIAFVIKKPEFAKIFPEHAPDPYFLSFSYIIGEFVKELNPRETGQIFAEKRNKILDKQFSLSWEIASKSRIGLVTNGELGKHHITKPTLLSKSWDYTGIEIADMISYRLSRVIMKKPLKAVGNELDIKIFKQRLRLGALPNL